MIEMKALPLIAAALCLVMISGAASAYSFITTDNQSRSTWNETFTGNQNVTLGFTLPQYSTAINATLNVSSYANYINYDYINTNYTSSGSGCAISDLPSMFDANFDTYAYCMYSSGLGIWTTYENKTMNGSIGNTYRNITIKYAMWATAGLPIRVMNVSIFNFSSNNWEILLNDVFSGCGLSTTCTKTTTLNIFKTNYINGNNINLKYTTQNNFTPTLFGARIDYDSNLNNPYLDTASSGSPWEWNYTGEFNSSVGSKQASLNATLINSYCSSYSTACNFPATAHSSTAGILQFSNISIPYVPYVVTAETYSSTAFEHDNAFSITLNTNDNVSQINGSLIWNGTSYPALHLGNTFSKTINTTLTSNNVTIPWYWNFSYNYSGTLDNAQTDSRNQTVYRIYLGNCSDGVSTTKALNLYLLDEENSTAINGTIEITNNITASDGTSRNYSFTFSQVTNASICIYPPTESFLDDAMLQYYATGYTSRTYFIYTTLSNVTQDVNLYLLQNGLSYSSVFYLRDEYGNPYTNAIIQVERYFTGTNTYKLVAQCKSDSPTGKCATYLRTLDVYYRYIILKNLVVVRQTTPTTIVCTPFEAITSCPPYPIPISVTTFTPDNYWQRLGAVSYSVTVNNATGILSATVVDASGTMNNASLIVKKKAAISFTTICSLNGTAATQTFTCNLGNTSGNIYSYELSGSFDGSRYAVIDSGFADYSSAIMDWGNLGPIAAFLLIGTMYFLGRSHPVAAMSYAGLGLIATYMLGITPLANITSLIAIFIVIGTLVWKSK